MSGHFITHDLDGADHNGVAGAVEDNLVSFDASGKPKDSGVASSTAGLLPEYQSFWHDGAVEIAGNDLSLTVNIPHVGAFYAVPSPAADGDAQSHPFQCASGNYTFNLYCVTSPDSGSIDIKIDDSTVATFDLYSSGTTYVVLKKQITIAISAGAHTLKIVVNGKNVSSSGYKAQLTQYWLEKE